MQHRDKTIIYKVISEIDIAAHKYQTLRMEDVYNTVCIDFPRLKEQLCNLIKNNK